MSGSLALALRPLQAFAAATGGYVSGGDAPCFSLLLP